MVVLQIVQPESVPAKMLVCGYKWPRRLERNSWLSSSLVEPCSQRSMPSCGAETMIDREAPALRAPWQADDNTINTIRRAQVDGAVITLPVATWHSALF